MKFKTIYADPPWQFNDKLDDSRKKPYTTMTIEDLCELPVRDIADKEAHLYLWVASAFLEEGFQVIKAWGFDYKCHIVWLKRTKKGKIWFGMGHYFRHCNEICLFATRDNLKTRTNNTRNFIDTQKPSRFHAAKPDEMYELIENNSFPPFLELFATITRPHWSSLGYMIDERDIKQSIKDFLPSEHKKGQFNSKNNQITNFL